METTDEAVGINGSSGRLSRVAFNRGVGVGAALVAASPVIGLLVLAHRLLAFAKVLERECGRIMRVRVQARHGPRLPFCGRGHGASACSFLGTMHDLAPRAPFRARSLRWLLLIASVTLGVAMAPPEAHAQSRLIVASASPEVTRRTLTFDEVRARRASVDVDLASGPVELYPSSASAIARQQSACLLSVASNKLDLDFAAPPTEACRKLFAPVLAARRLEIAVSQPGSTRFAVIDSEVPDAYQGPATRIEVDRGANDAPQWATAKLPPHVVLAAAECHLLLDKWHQLTCNVSTGLITATTPAVSAVIAARFGKNEELTLYAKVLDAGSSDGAWRAFPFLLKPKPPATQPTLTTPTDSLEARCRTDVVKYIDKSDFYVACVDAFPAQKFVVTFRCGRNDPATCQPNGEMLDSGHDFVVRVYHDPGDQEQVTLSGAVGTQYLQLRTPPTHKGFLAKWIGGAAPVPAPFPVWYFDSRKPGSATLAVTVTRLVSLEKPLATVADVQRAYTVRGIFNAVLRFGLGMTWAPWARKVDVLTTADGQRYAGVVEGSGAGLFNTELVAGLTYFPWPVREDSADVRLAFGVRLGLVSVGSDGKWFSSVMIGPELAIGTDFSIGLMGGIVQHDLPNSDYEPGTLLSSSAKEIRTHFSVAPAFGLALNLTPDLFKVFKP